MRALGGCLTVVLLVVALVPDEAAPQSRRRACRQSCGAAIDACVAEGGRRRRCKNQTLRRCRRQGLSVCAATTTTTTVAGVTSTTSGGGSTTTNPGGSTTTVTTPGGTTTTTATVHGCSLGAATDLRGDPSPEVSFTIYSYSPKCSRITAGQSITFTGNDFDFHPLVGGEVGVGPDPGNPIGITSVGTSKNVTFPSAGTFPFYCGAHGPSFGMTGAVFVDPP
jgi:plastocyanin